MGEVKYPQSFEKFIADISTRGTNVEYFKHFTADEMKELKSGRPLKKKYFKIRAKQLVLKGNNLGDEGAQAFSEFLRKNTFLHTFAINSNKVGLAGAEAIADALKENKVLKKISLQHNRLADDAIEAVGSVLVYHDSIQHVSFNGNSYTRAGHARLMEISKRNPALTLIGKNNVEINEDHSGGQVIHAIASAVSAEALETEVGKILERMELSSFAERFYEEKVHTKEQAMRLRIEDYDQLGVEQDLRSRLEQAFNKGIH